MQKAQDLEAEAMTLRACASQAKKENIKKGGIEEWLDVQFESSSGLTEEFALFAKQFKKAIAKQMQGYEIVKFSRGHFYISSFFKNSTNGKLVYISSDDVRGSNGWYNSLLIRTAQHDKDYTGGSNNLSPLHNLKEQADRLTGEDLLKENSQGLIVPMIKESVGTNEILTE